MVHTRRIPPANRRRGSVYLMCLGSSLLVATIGYSVLMINAIQVRRAQRANDALEAEILTHAATEHALGVLATDTAWRTTYRNNVATSPVPLGRGTISWKLIDESDGDLGNRESDRVRLYGIGRVGKAARLYSVELKPTRLGLEVLQTVVHATGNISTQSNFTANGGPLSSNSNITLGSNNIIYGDVDAASITYGSGSITGKVTAPAPLKEMPNPGVFDLWKAKATLIPQSAYSGGTLGKVVLSDKSNPWGTPNPEGIYFLDVPSGTKLTIDQCRIVGTLIVHAQGNVVIKSGVVWEPLRPNYPALIVSCSSSVSVDLDGSGTLSESQHAINFNPAGTPFNGESDSDLSDVYSPRLRGIFHVLRAAGDTSLTTVRLDQQLKGTLLVDGSLVIKSGTATWNRETYENAPDGYSAGISMVPVPGTWRREPDQ